MSYTKRALRVNETFDVCHYRYRRTKFSIGRRNHRRYFILGERWYIALCNNVLCELTRLLLIPFPTIVFSLPRNTPTGSSTLARCLQNTLIL
ncbi:hypothetical protein I7I48_03750 [Histoplasma ohiense]|nr:hypothetical protein I7I48_03750 [Histoplasma ohiense (nom. inval.)]